MLLFKAFHAKNKLVFTKLSDCIDEVSTAAKWAEKEWGYIRNKGIEFREEIMRNLSEHVYIGFYADIPVAMFALLPHQFDTILSTESHPPLKTFELMYVYVEEQFRGFGFGYQIINKAKNLALIANADLILLETLKPKLNRMYEKYGAKEICESNLYSHTTNVLSIQI